MRDPIWDIEQTEGFEDHIDELRAFRLEKEAEWQLRIDNEVMEYASKIGLSDNIVLAKYILRLEQKVDFLEYKLNGL